MRNIIFQCSKRIMSHVSSGDRAYLTDSDSYGDVNRTTILGVPGVVVYDDEGGVTAYCGTEASSASVVNKTTGKNGKGVDVSMPTDVKSEGTEVLAALEIEPEKQSILFVKFMGMFSKEQRRAYIDEWNEKKNDPVEKETFLNGLITDLEDDEVFITNEGKKAFIGIEEEVQHKMFSKLLTTLDASERESYIIQWMQVKNDKYKKEEFLQGMYELLMDDDDYIVMEGKKALTKVFISTSEQTNLFNKFLEVVDPSTRSDLVKEWRSVRRSKSRKGFFLKNLIGLIGTD